MDAALINLRGTGWVCSNMHWSIRSSNTNQSAPVQTDPVMVLGSLGQMCFIGDSFGRFEMTVFLNFRKRKKEIVCTSSLKLTLLYIKNCQFLYHSLKCWNAIHLITFYLCCDLILICHGAMVYWKTKLNNCHLMFFIAWNADIKRKGKLKCIHFIS